jgi:hypothetical protein
MFELFSGIRLYLEDCGDIVAEFLPAGGSLHYVTFHVGQWEPTDDAPSHVIKAHNNAMRKSEKMALVFDIFTGDMIVGRQREKRLGDMLLAAVDEM